eukprot:6218790-Prymnesium_polylepis.1
MGQPTMGQPTTGQPRRLQRAAAVGRRRGVGTVVWGAEVRRQRGFDHPRRHLRARRHCARADPDQKQQQPPSVNCTVAKPDAAKRGVGVDAARGHSGSRQHATAR